MTESCPHLDPNWGSNGAPPYCGITWAIIGDPRSKATLSNDLFEDVTDRDFAHSTNIEAAFHTLRCRDGDETSKQQSLQVSIIFSLHMLTFGLQVDFLIHIHFFLTF